MEPQEGRPDIPREQDLHAPMPDGRMLARASRGWPIRPFLVAFLVEALIQSYMFGGDFGSSIGLSMHVAALWDLFILVRWAVSWIMRSRTNDWIIYIVLHVTFTIWFPFFVNWAALLRGSQGLW